MQPFAHFAEGVCPAHALIRELPVQVLEVGRLVLVEVDQVVRQLLDGWKVVDVDERLRGGPLGVPKN